MNLWIAVLLLAICYGSETCNLQKVKAFVSKKPWIVLGLVLVFLWMSQRNEGVDNDVNCGDKMLSTTKCPAEKDKTDQCKWGAWHDLVSSSTFKTECCDTGKWKVTDGVEGTYEDGCETSTTTTKPKCSSFKCATGKYQPKPNKVCTGTPCTKDECPCKTKTCTDFKVKDCTGSTPKLVKENTCATGICTKEECCKA
jgi:hypothetical protein